MRNYQLWLGDCLEKMRDVSDSAVDMVLAGRGRNIAHVLQGDALYMLRQLPDECIQTCITSPPYYGLRDYGHSEQIGAEKTPQEYVARLVEVFREVRRVLKKDGTLWLNLGDSYASSAKGSGGSNPTTSPKQAWKGKENGQAFDVKKFVLKDAGVKAKDLLGIPWMVAFALRDDGWFLRQDIIWHKPNPMPESVRDRCTKAHEYVFLMSKSGKYKYDTDAIKEPSVDPVKTAKRYKKPFGGKKADALIAAGYITQQKGVRAMPEKRNRRSVWTITPKPFRGAHFATMPPALVEPCILAGSSEGDIVLDPFSGAGTVGIVASQKGRQYLGIELNAEYIELTRKRFAKEGYNLE